MITALAFFAAAFAIDECARLLISDVRLAMKRADLSLDFVARTIKVPIPKLSDQLNGKTPFTSWWRFASKEIRATDFWLEFHDIEAGRLNRMLVRYDVGRILAGVDELVEDMRGRKRMAKATLAAADARKAGAV